MGRHSGWPILLLVGIFGLALFNRSSGGAFEQGGTAEPQPRSSKALALSQDGSLLVVANPDSNSISLVDTAGSTILAEIETGVDPRTVALDESRGLVYVANRGSDSVAVVDIAAGKVVDHIPTGRAPYGLVLSTDGRFLYVTESLSGRLRIIKTENAMSISQIHLGDRPSGIALSANGETLYVTHLLDNKISVLDMTRPYLAYFPLAAKGQQLSADNHQQQAAAPHSLIPLWPDSNLVQSIIIGPDGETAYVPHTRSNTTNKNLTFDTTVTPLVSFIDLVSGQHQVGLQLDLATLDPPGVGLPFDAALTSNGDELWVANAASNDITVINMATRSLVAHIEVGSNPRAIIISADGSAAYANNTLDGTVSIINPVAYTVTATIPVTQIPLPPLLLEGKRLFHSSDDPRMTSAQWIACSTCHFDGGHDGRTWTFGFAGPRNTTSLLGMVETYPLRWSAEWDESADAEFAIRKENFGLGLLDGVMHCDIFPPDCADQPPNQGRSSALDALAAFMDSLVMPLSPRHTLGQPLTAIEASGREIFNRPSLGCTDCHPPPLYTDRQKHDVGTTTSNEQIGPAYDTPSLRGLYDSAPYFHDGSAATLEEALTLPTPNGEHDLRIVLSQGELAHLVAYLRALPYE